MSVSGISSGNASTVYQWQKQQLQQRASGASATSVARSNILGNYTSMSAQLSSMLELTRYAMDAMGVEEGQSRVTFSQITKYREGLRDEFTAAVKEQLATLGVSDPASLTFTLEADGTLAVTGGQGSDSANAQAWLTANPQLGTELLASFQAAGLTEDVPVPLTLGENGSLMLANTAPLDDAKRDSIQGVLDSSRVGTRLYAGLRALADAEDAAFTLKVDDTTGDIHVESTDPTVKTAIQNLLESRPELAKTFRQIEALSGLDSARQAMQISPTALRRRIEIESLASWWVDSGNTSSMFGTYGKNTLSLLSGLNLSV